MNIQKESCILSISETTIKLKLKKKKLVSVCIMEEGVFSSGKKLLKMLSKKRFMVLYRSVWRSSFTFHSETYANIRLHSDFAGNVPVYGGLSRWYQCVCLSALKLRGAGSWKHFITQEKWKSCKKNEKKKTLLGSVCCGLRAIQSWDDTFIYLIFLSRYMWRRVGGALRYVNQKFT